VITERLDGSHVDDDQRGGWVLLYFGTRLSCPAPMGLYLQIEGRIKVEPTWLASNVMMMLTAAGMNGLYVDLCC